MRRLSAALLLAAAAAQAQPSDDVAAGAPVRVELLTMGQGDAIWERFGHNSLRISDLRTASDVAWNWGLFDFAEPGFLVRFLTGETRYWMGGFSVPATLQGYAARNRSVAAQVLALGAAQRARLDAFVRRNALPEHRYYTYDYFLDNCSTRLRDALDAALGGQLRQQTERVGSGTTFRRETQRLLEGSPLVYAGITIALGQPADREISAWEEMFLPGRLQQRLRQVQVDTGGARVPLVHAEQELVGTSGRAPERMTAGRYVPAFLGVGVAIGVALLLLGRARSRAARVAFVTLATSWLTLGGAIGIILTLAWVATRHVFWYRNENLLLLNPLLLVLAVLMPLAVRRSAGARLHDWTIRLATAVGVLSVLAVLLKILPMFHQQNWEVIALVLPVHLAVVLAGRRLLTPHADATANAS